MKRARVAAAVLLVGGLFPLGAAPAACAAEGPHAALVVDTGAADAFRYCVALPDASVTGIELIQLASEQHGLQYRLGYGGNVVCQLAGVGYESDECLKEGPEFWGYWRGDGSGGWDWSSSGGNATTVEDGDVEGWAWGTGNDGSSHPAPPATTFPSVCGRPAGAADRDLGTKGNRDRRAHRPDKTDDQKRSRPATPTRGDTSEGEPHNARSRRAGGDKTRKQPTVTRRGKKGVSDSPAPALTTSPTPPPVATEPTSSEGGPPVGAAMAVLAMIGAIGGGLVIQRRRLRSR